MCQESHSRGEGNGSSAQLRFGLHRAELQCRPRRQLESRGIDTWDVTSGTRQRCIGTNERLLRSDGGVREEERNDDNDDYDYVGMLNRKPRTGEGLGSFNYLCESVPLPTVVHCESASSTSSDQLQLDDKW